MLFFRWVVFLLLITAGVSFGAYVATGQERYKHFGLLVLKWTVLAGLGFFLVLLLERI
ncbi:MAG: hypothetical protein ACT4NV_19920 [Rhodoferax sp.]